MTNSQSQPNKKGRNQRQASVTARDRRALRPQRGEELVTITIDDRDPAFPALVAAELWNGAAIPRFRPEVAEFVVDWINDTYAKYPDGSARAHWDGDTIVLTRSDGDTRPSYIEDRVEPDDDGRYGIGARAWVWEFVS
ncbi:hypothetical protein CFP71_09955 [Amycolatopsis thailandensis]|uniref:Uncharacterized protein n=1 Tax=Amycolatopsis thailandensis TaxID=589330 RepID=A0A229SDX7_9PSEU|nr:hypothetical protein [Amycolatopsis thailandensis]OXM57050.1 hypothetical protein CFP71_09955 [Amycolatopsis thailandensis]